MNFDEKFAGKILQNIEKFTQYKFKDISIE